MGNPPRLKGAGAYGNSNGDEQKQAADNERSVSAHPTRAQESARLLAALEYGSGSCFGDAASDSCRDALLRAVRMLLGFFEFARKPENEKADGKNQYLTKGQKQQNHQSGNAHDNGPPVVVA